MKTIEWQYLIVSYLFLGGLSAGLYFVSSLVELFRRPDHAAEHEIARCGALLAPWPVMIGSALLVFDLGNWYRFYKLFLHFRWESPMSIGSWLLTLFIFISLLSAYGWIPAEQRNRFFAKLPRRFHFLWFLNRDVSTLRRPLAIAGLPISVGVAIYTGVLLGAVQSRPFWNTNLVAQLFLFSALSSGCAFLLVFLALTQRRLEMFDFRLLYILDIGFLTLEFFIVVPYLLHGELSVLAVRESLQLILGGPFTILFWVFFLVLGLILPWLIEIREVLPLLSARASLSPDLSTVEASPTTLQPSSVSGVDVPTLPAKLHFGRASAIAAAALILMGGILVRYIFVFAGQMSAFH
jgi:formate-dependent nitrite reductase membrane component NrfD